MRFYISKLRLVCLVTFLGVTALVTRMHSTPEGFISPGILQIPMFYTRNINKSSTYLTSNVTAAASFLQGHHHHNSSEAEEVRGHLKKPAPTHTGQEVMDDATTHTGQEVRGDARTHKGQEVKGDARNHTGQEVKGNARTHTGQEVRGDVRNHTGQEVKGDLKKPVRNHTGQEVKGDPTKPARNHTGQEVRGDRTKPARNHTGQGVRGDRTKPARPQTGVEARVKTMKPGANIGVPWTRENRSLSLCPPVPQGLHGYGRIDTHPHNWTEISRLNPGLEPGGHYQPPFCKARHRVAIIVPYRDRESHLQVMLHNLHPMLTRQQLDYFVLVVELAKPTTFNRGMLLNIGAVEAQGLWDVQCFIFHDVDLVPENDRNLYTCPEHPRHMSAAVDKFGYKLPYKSILGGVAAISVKDFYKVNGYSNMYFGWGGEDDDFSGRLAEKGLGITRYSMDIARYRMIWHKRDKHNAINPKRFQLLSTYKKRQATDGLNSLEYRVQKMEFRPAYTWILVNVDKQKIMKNYKTGSGNS